MLEFQKALSESLVDWAYHSLVYSLISENRKTYEVKNLFSKSLSYGKY